MIAQKSSKCDTKTETILVALFHDACRVCMGNKGPMINLFSQDEDLIELNVKLYTCIPTININEEGIPKQICKACVKKLRIAYKFRQSCINTTQYFMRYINKSTKKVKTYSNKNVYNQSKKGLTDNIMDVDINILFKDNPEMYSNRDRLDIRSINTSNGSFPSTLPETQCCTSDSLPCDNMHSGHSDTIIDLDLQRVETIFDKHIVLDSIPEKSIDHSMYDCNLYSSETVFTDLRFNSTESVSTSYKLSNSSVSTTSPVLGDSSSKIVENSQVSSDDDQTTSDSNSCISISENKSSNTPADVITRDTTIINQKQSNETKLFNISNDFLGFNHSEIKFSNKLITKLTPLQDDIIMLLYKFTEMKKIKITTPKIKYKNTNLIKGKQLIISSQEISDSQNISTKMEKNFKKPIRKRQFLDMNISQKISNYLHNFKLQRKSKGEASNSQGKRNELILSVNKDVNKATTSNSLENETIPEKINEPDIQTVSNIEEINLIDTIKTEPEDDNILENENNLLNYQPFEEIGKYEEPDKENELTDDYLKEQGIITIDCTNHNDHNYCVASPKQSKPYKTITTYEKIKNPENILGLDEFISEPLEKFTHENPCKCSTGKRLNVLTQIKKFYNDKKGINKQKIFVKSIETLTKPENQKNKKILKNPKFLLKPPKRNTSIKQKLSPEKSETKKQNKSDTSAEDENLSLHNLKRKITDNKQKTPMKRERKRSTNIKKEIKEPVKIKNLGKLVDVKTIADFTSIKINETTNEKDFDNPYVCELCDKGFQSLKKLEAHLTSHVSESKTDIASLNDILMQEDSQNDTNTCEYCNRKFRTATGLFTHKYKIHVTEIETEFDKKNLIKENEEYTCTLCYRIFASEKYLRIHFTRFH